MSLGLLPGEEDLRSMGMTVLKLARRAVSVSMSAIALAQEIKGEEDVKRDRRKGRCFPFCLRAGRKGKKQKRAGD